MKLRRRAVAVISAALSLLVLPSPVAERAHAYPGSNVELEGAGWGHGRGMGQYGALGYALDHGWSYQKILDHFYGGTAAGDIDNPTISVRLLAWDDTDTLAYSSSGLSVSGVGGSPKAVRVRRTGSGQFVVETANGCGGPWGSAVNKSGNIDIHPSPGKLVGLCESGGVRAYRGFMRVLDSGAGQRLVNHVDLDGYLKGVVPRESPASWGDLGGGKGMHALRAQAVAARSYAWAENRYKTTGGTLYAKTCDTTACQVYRGYSLGSDVLESANTNQAIADTSGVVRAKGSSTQRTEFSSSTGGHTAGGTFPAVADAGDSISSNPNHRWSANVSVSSIESAYPSIGSLRTVDVTERNGLGAWGGRVKTVVLRGTKGSVSLSGNEMRSRFGLKSDWFRVVNNPSGGVSGYFILDHAGGVFAMGDARYKGSVPGLRAAGVNIGRADVVGITTTPSGRGYWVLDSAGGIFSFGDARFYGSVPGLRAEGRRIGQARIIGMAASPSGKGYWILDSAGGMFAFGDARFKGSVPGLRASGIEIGPATIIGMTPTPSGRGYWILDSQGGIFAFGDARYAGSIPQLRSEGVRIGRMQVMDIAASPSGRGYWMLDSQGGIFAFGDARYAGSMPAAGIAGRAVAMVPTKTGRGYLVVTAAGGAVHPFGDAPDFGGIKDATGVDTTGLDIAAVPES